MRVLDLFSGIGGFSLGLERAGMQTVAFCENDDFCRKVLAKHWPDVTIHNSIEELDGKKYRGSIELVCCGWPCQPWSVAGRRLGSRDDRHLWPEVHRIVRQVQPRWFIGENVPGLVRLGLDPALSDLEDEGYTSQTFNIGAIAVDAPHIRQRIFIISHKNVADSESAKRKRLVPEQDGTQNRSSDNGEDVADSTGERIQRLWAGGEQEPQTHGRQGLPMHEGERCRPPVSETQPCLGGVADGVSRWMDEPGGLERVTESCPDRIKRIKALGNAVVPQVVEVLGKFIMEIHHNNGHSTEDGD